MSAAGLFLVWVAVLCSAINMIGQTASNLINFLMSLKGPADKQDAIGFLPPEEKEQ